MNIIPSPFQQFSLNEEETKMGSTFNEYQLAYLHNLRTEALLAKNLLQVDTKDINSYIQNEAAFAGQINLLNHLIDINSLKGEGL
jgi:hypothetical protein